MRTAQAPLLSCITEYTHYLYVKCMRTLTQDALREDACSATG